MTEKEKNILSQELWVLISLSFEASKQDFGIMQKILTCVTKEESGGMTPNKRKVIGELRLQWCFMQTLREDLAGIANKLGRPESVPVLPALAIGDALWQTGKSGLSDGLYETMDKIGDFRSALQDCAFELQELCA